MAANLRRSDSMKYPPDRSELMNKLKEHSASFIREFASSEYRMTQIVGEFREITDKDRKRQERTDKYRIAGYIAAGVGLGIGLLFLAAPLTGGASLAVAAAVLAVVAGGAVLYGVNETKTRKEIESAKKVEELGKDFMEIVERLKKDLKEIKRTCEKLEQRSAELQAGNTLTDMEDFQRILTPDSEDKSEREIPVMDYLCRRVVDDCEKMKKELKAFTEK
ncbi:uncharacterized protein LOC114570737 [Perca flavescens]|uniref:uncharacterized protein LOC114570737 n=1 Tax=Perca flavescens TaxID=8167 RepID=UPI00106EC3EE|nr:uncharacterized protein LOC114570737 [Perca flavescens]XP_028457037.1 uncharacterized protein LOC114570737 [Perca flavescens]XP_028457038.1 uncharacterized protein LOC114570737 [Perca flavescens]XP_028457039.1 uncharacterized protein LOC114570737 [Perca flavescens]